MKMLKMAIISAVSVFLFSCGGMQWERPAAQYRDCMKENQDDPSKCDKYKESYEKQIDSYRGGAGNQHGEGGFYNK